MIVQEVIFGTLHALPFISGPIANNAFAVYDESTKDCVVIDPSFSFERFLAHLEQMGLQPREYWLTHAHFDHIIGTACPESLNLGVDSHMHPEGEILYNEALQNHRRMLPTIVNTPKPVMDLEDGKLLHVGNYTFQTLYTPGHAPGHCCFYCEQAGWLFSGDLVFFQSYGRTDLTGGSEAVLMKSIREKVLTLPDETLVMPGHEDFTTVGDEKVFY